MSKWDWLHLELVAVAAYGLLGWLYALRLALRGLELQTRYDELRRDKHQ